MAYVLSVNIEYMFTEAGTRLEDRIAAAVRAGFTRVEMFTTADRDVASLARALADNGAELVTLLVDPRTRLIDPETHAGFREMFRRTAQAAVTLGCRNVVVGSGPGAPYMKRAVQLGIVADAVASIVPIAEDLGLTVLLEPVNTRVDHPGVLFSQTIDAVTVIERVASARVRLLYDIYHSITEGEDPAGILQRHGHLLGHVQIADVPGRGEPGSGTVDWPAIFGLLRKTGYAGMIGIECTPTRATAEALAYVRGLHEPA